MDQLSIVHAFQSESTFLVDVPTSILRSSATPGVRRSPWRGSNADGIHETFMNALPLPVDSVSNVDCDSRERKELSVMRVVHVNGSRAFHRRFLAQCEAYCRLCCRLQRSVEWLLSRRSRHGCMTTNTAVVDSTLFDVDCLSQLVFPVEPTAFVAAAFALPPLISVVPALSNEDAAELATGVGGDDDVGSSKETQVVQYCFFYGFPEQRMLRGKSGSGSTNGYAPISTSCNGALLAETSRMSLMDRFIAVSNATGVCGAASMMHDAIGRRTRTRIGLTLSAYLECRLPRSVSDTRRTSQAARNSSEWSREDPFSCWSDDILWRLLGLLVSALSVVHAAGFHFRGQLSADDVLCFALPDSSDEEAQLQTSTSTTAGRNTVKWHGGIESIAHQLISRTAEGQSHWLINDTTPAHHAFFMFTTPPRSLFPENMRGGEEEEEGCLSAIDAAQCRDTAALGRILVAVVAEAKRRRGARGAATCSELFFVAQRMSTVDAGGGLAFARAAVGGALGETPSHRFAQLQAVQLRTHLWLLRSIVEERDMQLATLMLYHSRGNENNKGNETSHTSSNNLYSDRSRSGSGGKVTHRSYQYLTGEEAYLAKLKEREGLLAEREEKLNQFLLIYGLTTERLDELPAGNECFDRLRESLRRTPHLKEIKAAPISPAARSAPMVSPAPGAPSSAATLAIAPRTSPPPTPSAPVMPEAAITTTAAATARAATAKTTRTTTTTTTTTTAAAAASTGPTTRRLSSAGGAVVTGVSVVRGGPSASLSKTQQKGQRSASPQKTPSAPSWSSLSQELYPQSYRRPGTNESTLADKTRPLYGLLRSQKNETSGSSAITVTATTSANASPAAAEILPRCSPIKIPDKEQRTGNESPPYCSPRVAPGSHSQRIVATTKASSTLHSNGVTMGHTSGHGNVSSKIPAASSLSIRRQKSTLSIISSRSHIGRVEAFSVGTPLSLSSGGKEGVSSRRTSSKFSKSASIATISSSARRELPSQHVVPVRTHERTPLTRQPTTRVVSPDLSPLVRTTDDNSSLLISIGYKSPLQSASTLVPPQSRGSPLANTWNKAPTPTPHSATPQGASRAQVRFSMSPHRADNCLSFKNASTTPLQPTSATTEVKPSNNDSSPYSVHGQRETGTVAATAAPSPFSPPASLAVVGVTTATTPARATSGRKAPGKSPLSGYGGSTKTEARSDAIPHVVKHSEEKGSSLAIAREGSYETPRNHLQDRKDGGYPITTAATTITTTGTMTTNKGKTPGSRSPGATRFSPLGDNSVTTSVSLDVSAGPDRSSHADSYKRSEDSQQRRHEREEGMTSRAARSRLAGDGWVNHHLAVLEQLRYDFHQSEVIKSARNTPNGKAALRGGRERAADSIEPPRLSQDISNVEKAVMWGTRSSDQRGAAAHTGTTTASLMY